MEPVNLSESKIYLIEVVKIFLFWILSKLDFPYWSKSAKAVSEKLEILILISLKSSKRVLLKNPSYRKKCIVRNLSWNGEKPSSRPEVFLKISQNSWEGACTGVSFLNKVAGWRTPVEGISSKFCKVLKNNSFKENFRTTASGNDPGEYLAFLGNSLQNVSFLRRHRHDIIFRDV